MKKNRISIVILALTMCIGLLSGCGKSEETTTNEKISVVCTTFPQYDWVSQLVEGQEEHYELTLLLDDGVDLHNYQPTAEDMVKIASCDVFIYVGGESDDWVEDALKEATNSDMKVVNLMEVLGDNVKEEEVIEGMEAEEEEHETEEEDEIEYDEHIWLSIKNASILVEKIAEVLEDASALYANVISENAKNYIAELSALDQEYEDMVQNAARTTVLFGDRFPFRYLVDDYGLDYYAAFVGCSAETEASFETITFLSGKVDELELPAILVIEKSDQKIAQSIVDNTKSKDQNILVMNSLQSVTNEDISSGETYLSIMRDNLEILKEALN